MNATGRCVALALLSTSAAAAEPGLFACRVIVTGTDMRSRPAALERCVRDVAIKVTGRPDLADDPRVQAIARRAPELVEDIAYLDRMTDIPKHDDQGTRDQPFDLIAHVSPEALEAELAKAGLKPWLERPPLLTLATIARGEERYPLSADGDRGERQRQALLAAGETYGLRIALPTEAQALAPGGVRAQDLPIGRARQPVATLTGSLHWSEADFGWNAEWRLAGRATGWSVRGVSFDEAFRAGVGGAARVLSAQ